MQTLIERITAHHAGRDPERLAIKYREMREDAFSFLRGTAFLFNTRLPVLPAAPTVWACGDLHLENFGSYKGDNRQVYFDINDFDEAALAPATLDLLRLLSSLHVAAPSLCFDADVLDGLCRAAVDHYATTLASGKASWVERDTATGLVGKLLGSLRERSRLEFLDSRTVLQGKQRRIRFDNDKALPMSKAEREALLAFMQAFADTQPDPRFYKPLDVARRISGNASLGVPRYIILVRGHGSPDENYLLDLKAAGCSSLSSPVAGKRINQAERVIAAQRRMQAAPVSFLHALRFDGQDFILRELQPSQDRVDLARCKNHPRRLAGLLQTLAEMLAWAQLRSAAQAGSASIADLQEFTRRKAWRVQLLKSAERTAQQVRMDWDEYCAAFDAGHLG